MEKQPLFDEANREWDAGNLTSALKLFIKAAKEGETSALNSIGYMIDHGLGTRKDTKKAFHWYKRAARLGDGCAFSNIAIFYRDKGNFTRARHWFLKAVDRFNDGDALLELGKLYLKRKTTVSLTTAIRYLRRASTSKNITPSAREEAEMLLLQ